MSITHPHGPMEALQQHVDLVRWWQKSKYAPGVGEGYRDMIEIRRSSGQPIPVYQYLGTRLDEADTYFMRSHIVYMLWGHVEDNELDEPITQEMLPSEDGYIWLENPIYSTDFLGKMISIRVITWFSHPNGIGLGYFADKKDEYDEINTEMKKEDRELLQYEPRTPLHHFDFVPWGYDRYQTFDLESMDRLERMEEHAERMKKFHPSLTDTYKDMDPEKFEQSIADTNIVHQFLFAAWDFMTDQLPVIERPTRQVYRRLVREGSRHLEVRVIDLRTKRQLREDGEFDPQLVIWSHRWRSRAHLRHYRNPDGSVRKVVRVRGSVKGPKHLPLIEKDSVFHVRR